MLFPLSKFTYDMNLKLSMSHNPDDKIVIVGIDDASMQKYGIFPWDRKLYIPLIQNLENSGAKVIAFDIIFDTESKDKTSDTALANEFAKYNNIVLPSYGEMPSSPTKSNELVTARNFTRPLPIFAANTKTGHINRLADSDGKIRKSWLMINDQDKPMYSMAYTVSELYGKDASGYLNKHPQTQMYIKYDGNSKDFTTLSFAKVAEGAYSPDTFKDKIVLIGFTGPGYDESITPVERNMKLVYVHANIISQLLSGEYITYVSMPFIFFLNLIAIALVIFLAWKFNSTLSAMLTLGIMVLLALGQYLLFSGTGIFFDVVYIILALFVTYLVNVSIKAYRTMKEKEHITRQFGRYISPDLVSQIVKEQIDIKLGGILKDISILFLDIRGFTPMSEKLNPEEVVDVLNNLFNMVTKNVLKNKGTIDKFIGDAAMVIFNAPLELPDHEYHAVKTALDIQKDMEEIAHEILAKYEVELAIGIGVNCGQAVIGNIGSYLRLDYTAIGDNVNTAARLESNAGRREIYVSEETYERTKDKFVYEYVKEAYMKGKTIPIKIYKAVSVLNDEQLERAF